MNILSIFSKFFKAPASVPLGRWRLKHNFSDCDAYLKNGYGDPGYPNVEKEYWIKRLNTNQTIETCSRKCTLKIPQNNK